LPARGQVRRDGRGVRIARLGGPDPGNAVTAMAAMAAGRPGSGAAQRGPGPNPANARGDRWPAPEPVPRATRAGAEPRQRQLAGDLEHHAVLRAMRTSVVVPPVLEPLGAPDPVTLSAAAVFSLLPVLRATRQAARQAYRDSPVGCLLRLDEELTPQTMPAPSRHWARRFVMGV
jgi:hypothetical protein